MATNAPPYHFEHASGYSVVTLHPELNEVQWASIEKIGSDVLGQLNSVRSPSLMIDLSALSYMGSAMVALVVRLWKSVTERSGRMVVVNQHDMVLEVLRLAGLANVWTIVRTRDEALSSLGVAGRASGERKAGGGIAAASVLVAAAAVALVCLPHFGVKALPADTARLAALGTAALGLILATVGATRSAGGARVLAFVALLASVAAGAFSVKEMRDARHGAAGTPEKADSAKGAASPTPGAAKTDGTSAPSTPVTAPTTPEAKPSDASGPPAKPEAEPNADDPGKPKLGT